MESYKTPLLVLLLLTLLSLTSTSASAQILYNNGVGTTGPGDYANSDPGTTYSEAGDVFTPTFGPIGTVGTVNIVDFSGLYYNAALPNGTPPTSDSFVFSLYLLATPSSAPSGTPTITDSFSSYSRVTANGDIHTTSSGTQYTVYQFSGFLETPFTITSGTSYYFGISDQNDSDQNFAVDLSSSVPPGGSSLEYSLTTATSTFDGPVDAALAFQLESVPEPKGWELGVLACSCLVLLRRCARRSPLA
jgi:hypothetical protein